MDTYQSLTYNPHGGKKLLHVLQGRCPRCGQGKVFESANPYNLRSMLNTKPRCECCQLNFVPEVGFYWGATYVSYAFTVAFSVFTFVISTMLFGFMNSLSLTYVAVNGVLLFIISPLSFRLSRVLWLWMFYDREGQ